MAVCLRRLETETSGGMSQTARDRDSGGMSVCLCLRRLETETGGGMSQTARDRDRWRYVSDG